MPWAIEYVPWDAGVEGACKFTVHEGYLLLHSTGTQGAKPLTLSFALGY